jgi:hypothetical protein
MKASGDTPMAIALGLFWLWGIAGFVVTGMMLTASTGPESTFLVIAVVAFWIGGMVMLGLGSVLADIHERRKDRSDLNITK